MKTKTVKNKEGTFQYTRHDTPNSFTCGRCQSDKTSKIQVRWLQAGNPDKVICNGCYGFLCSQARG